MMPIILTLKQILSTKEHVTKEDKELCTNFLVRTFGIIKDYDFTMEESDVEDIQNPSNERIH